MEFPYLSTILFLPALGAVAVALWPGVSHRTIKRISFFFSALPLLLSLYLFLQFDRQGGFQFQERYDWIKAINAFYYLGVDGLSLPMVLLTTTLGFLAVLVSWKIELRPREYFAWLLLLETGILGVFMSLDLLLFFLFWEVELIPMYMLISIWGTGRKEYSAVKFVIYTLVGSAFMLAGILALYFATGTFDLTELTGMRLEGLRAVLPLSAIFWFIFLAFAIKLPMFPFHTWLPDAHTDAPTAVSVMLAGVLLKMGGYGMLRISFTILPDVARDASLWLGAFATVNILYGAVVTMVQTDLKRLIAYSSISHMGYVLLGISALGTVGLTGASMQMFTHGLITGMLFVLVGMVYDRAHTRQIGDLSGLAHRMPFIATMMVIAGLASLGLPALAGFVSEVTGFLGTFEKHEALTIAGVIGIAFAAGYILWTIQRVFWGEPNPKWAELTDATAWWERGPLLAMSVAILAVGVYPVWMMDVFETGVRPIAERLA